jgi:PAS domain S-box-containing protein
MLAVIITGLSVYAVTKRAIQQIVPIPPDASDAAVVQVYPFIFVLSIFGLAMGLALAFYVISPLRQLTNLAESASSLSATKKIKKEQPGSGAGVVFGELGEALEQMVGSIGSYVLDAYILDSVASGVITISQEGTITSFNPQAERILGHGAEEAKGVHYDAVFPEHQSNRQFRRILHDGIEQGMTVSSVEVTVLNKEEKEVLMGATLTPLLDEDGGRLGIVLSFKDLAAVKQAQARLQRADQLATLGSFAAGMAHEIRNPLASLQGLVDLLLEDVPEEDPKRRYLNTIQRNLTRLTGLTENLLSLAHPGDVRLERTHVNDILREVMQLARHERQDRAVTTKEHYADGLPDILVDSEKLSRAILNMVINAFQATPEWGTVTLESSQAGSDSPLPKGQEAIVVAVSNTGSYIPPGERQKLFTPFYTTKDRGVGLGLAIAHQIVIAHSGQLTVESDPAHGTTFRLFLPVEGPKKEKP